MSWGTTAEIGAGADDYSELLRGTKSETGALWT
jgi:hypothetical protein